MRLLDRYLLRELAVPFAYCLAGFLVFWISFDLFSDLDEFQRRGLWARDLVEYYLVRTPELLVTVVPVALLLALLYSLTDHARHHELTAIRAAGVSLWRVCLPHLGCGVLASIALFALNEFWVPTATEDAARVLTRRQPPEPGGLGPEWQRNLAFHNERDQRVWNLGAFNRETGEILGASLYWVQTNGLKRRLFAERAVFDGDTWVFERVRGIDYPATTNGYPTTFATNRLTLSGLTESPAQINSEIKFTELTSLKAAKRPRLALREILDYRRLHPRLADLDRAKLSTQFHARLAEPWKCLVVVLIALPFGAPSGRRNVFVGVASSIFLGFGYFILSSFALALGTGGYLPAWMAAWAPNALFALGGVILTQRVR